MKASFTALVLAFAASAGQAAPHLDLSVTLDPERRELLAQARFAVEGEKAVRFSLAAGFEVLSAEVDGQPVGVRRQPVERGTRYQIPLPGKTAKHFVRVRYRGTLAPLDAARTHRHTLAWTMPFASSEGSFLPAGSGWYPEIGTLFTWRLAVSTPEGQMAVAPGTPQRPEGEGGENDAVFLFDQPARGVDLFVGPYRVTEQRVETGGRVVTLRTYLHRELEPSAAGYLDAAGRFVARYSAAIAPYPYTHFSIVSSPLPAGLGLPSLTYLGREVLKLPFIKDISLGHEVLHNWWGNGVYVDPARGNWSEGLTTFMADYAYQEDIGAAAAREMRHGWLRDYAALPAGAERPLVDFRARSHTASSVIGYGKSAMLFFTLRQRLGEERWRAALRSFWQRHRFAMASFADLAAAFQQVADEDLSGFFEQWLEATGAPLFTVDEASKVGGADAPRLRITLSQQPPGYVSRVPVRVFQGAAYADVSMTVREDGTTREFSVPVRPGSVSVDPEFTVWRRLHPDEAPPVLRDVQAAPEAALTVLEPVLAKQADALARHFLEGGVVSDLPEGDTAYAYRLVVGRRESVDRWLAQRQLPGRPGPVQSGDAQVWIAEARAARLVVVSLPAGTEEARQTLELLAHRLPHLSRYSWLTFEDGRTAGRGHWPVASPRFVVE